MADARRCHQYCHFNFFFDRSSASAEIRKGVMGYLLYALELFDDTLHRDSVT
jgi:hypothetical protein